LRRSLGWSQEALARYRSVRPRWDRCGWAAVRRAPTPAEFAPFAAARCRLARHGSRSEADAWSLGQDLPRCLDLSHSAPARFRPAQRASRSAADAWSSGQGLPRCLDLSRWAPARCRPAQRGSRLVADAWRLQDLPPHPDLSRSAPAQCRPVRPRWDRSGWLEVRHVPAPAALAELVCRSPDDRPQPLASRLLRDCAVPATADVPRLQLRPRGRPGRPPPASHGWLDQARRDVSPAPGVGN